MRGPCVVEHVVHSWKLLSCALCVRSVCALYAPCMRSARQVHAMHLVSARCSFDKNWAHDNALSQIANFPCAGRAFPMRPLCVNRPLDVKSSDLLAPIQYVGAFRCYRRLRMTVHMYRNMPLYKSTM